MTEENRNNRHTIPKTDSPLKDIKQVEQVKEIVEQAKEEGWTLEKLGKKLENLNFDDIADKMANRLLMKFQEQDKPESKPDETVLVEKPQQIEVKEPEQKKQEKTGIFF